MHAHMVSHTCTHTQGHMYTHSHTHTLHTHAHAHMLLHMVACAHTHTHMHSHPHALVHTCTHTLTHIFARTHTRSHVYTDAVWPSLCAPKCPHGTDDGPHCVARGPGRHADPSHLGHSVHRVTAEPWHSRRAEAPEGEDTSQVTGSRGDVAWLRGPVQPA